MPMSSRFTIEIIETGRSGSIRYAEGPGQSYDFYWEFGGGEAVASITVPTPAKWAAALPWAADRRDEVLQRVAHQVCRQRCAGCRPRFGDNWIDLIK
jgi:hypothetical protein